MHGIADDILDRLDKMGSLNPPHFLRSAAGFRPRPTTGRPTRSLPTRCSWRLKSKSSFTPSASVQSSTRGPRVEAVLVETKSGRRAIKGQMFIDCSGVADRAAWAGAAFEKGGSGATMAYPTTKFMINAVDPDKAGRAWELIPKLMEEAERAGRHFPRKEAIVRPQRNPINGAPTLPRSRTRTDRRSTAPMPSSRAPAKSKAGANAGRSFSSFVRQHPGSATPTSRKSLRSSVFAKPGA